MIINIANTALSNFENEQADRGEDCHNVKKELN